MKEGSWKDWGQHCQTTFLSCRAHLPKPTEPKIVSFLLVWPPLLLGLWHGFWSWSMGPEDLIPNLIRILVKDFTPWWKKRNRGHIFPHFSWFTYVWCEDVILAMIAIFRPWGQVQDYHRESDPEPWYCCATEWTLEKFSFLFMWDKQTFISEPVSFCLFCPLKPKVAYFTYLCASYTLRLECKLHEDKDQV